MIASKKVIFLFLISTVILFSTTVRIAHSATSTVYSTGDTFITGDGHTNDNNGTNTTLKIKHPSSGYSHVLVKFSQSDISTAIGSGTLVSAKLRLYIETNYNNWGSGTNVDVHRITQNWTETQATWNCPIDTNLNNSNPDCATQWAGGTYATPQTATVLQTSNVTGWAEFDVTADVSAFLSGTSNYGWLARKRSSSASGSLDYTSREGNSNNTPRLLLTFSAAAPVVSASVSPQPNAQGWNNSNATVTCSCSDADGIASCTSPQQVTTEGSNQIVTCQGCDTLGFCTSLPVTVKLDKTPPTITASTTPTPNSYGWNNSNVTVSFQGSDSLSGINSVTSPIVVSTEGANQVVTGTATDRAGNSAQSSATVNIDKTAPVVAITSPRNGDTLNTCIPQTTVSVVENGSGIDQLECNGTTGSVNSGAFSCIAPVASGNDTILARAFDLAGNIGTATISITNTTTNGIITLESESPIIAEVGTEDTPVVYGSGFDSSMTAYLDGIQVPVTIISPDLIQLTTNFTSKGLHSLELKKPGCPQTSTLLEPGILSLSEGDVVAVPDSFSPDEPTVTLYGYPGSFQEGAQVYFATLGTSCSQNLIAAQSVTFLESDKIEIVPPVLGLGSYDILVNNPDSSSLCEAQGANVAEMYHPSGWDAYYACPGQCQSVEPPSTMQSGDHAQVKLRVKNPASQTWPGNSTVKIGSWNGAKWGVSTVTLPVDVPINHFYTFAFTIYAPSSGGPTLFNWSMRNEAWAQGDRWFGQRLPCQVQNTCTPGHCSSSICTGQMYVNVLPPPSCGGPADCPCAIPNDGIADTKELQKCLNNKSTVHLSPGTYDIDNPTPNPDNPNPDKAALYIPNGKTLTSTGSSACWTDGTPPTINGSNCATLKATYDAAMTNRILYADHACTIDRVIFDGNGDLRRGVSNICLSDGPRPNNIQLGNGSSSSTGFVVTRNVSEHAPCGSGLILNGKTWTVGSLTDASKGNLLLDNGAPKDSNTNHQYWADGITAQKCWNGTISNNVVVDPTDVGIASGGLGPNDSSSAMCSMIGNYVRQLNKHSFGGIGVSSQTTRPYAYWGRSEVRSNTVEGNNLTDFGLHMGIHPWKKETCVVGANVHDNTVSAAFLDLNIDGWSQGTVSNNHLLPPGGTMTLDTYANDCSPWLVPMRYSSWDFENITDNGQKDENGNPVTAAPWLFEGQTTLVKCRVCYGGTDYHTGCTNQNLIDPQGNCCRRNSDGTCY